jgi:hypothetical protein
MRRLLFLTTPDLTWFGYRASAAEFSLGEVDAVLPEFSRAPFAHGEAVNEYRDEIIRLPHGDDLRHIPVSTVSKRYALIQHREVFGWLRSGLKTVVGDDADDLPVELVMSAYGERMRMRVVVPDIGIDPGDNYKLARTVEVTNSVDRSCALDVRLSWLRLICTNGLSEHEDDRLRKIHHLDWMNSNDPAEFLADHLKNSDFTETTLRQWMATPVEVKNLAAWADTAVAKAWGKTLAARAYHIARTGYDGAVGRSSLPSQANVSSDQRVPGAPAPVETLYHLSQVLTWLAGRHRRIEDQQKMLEQVDDLLAPFLAIKLA